MLIRVAAIKNLTGAPHSLPIFALRGHPPRRPRGDAVRKLNGLCRTTGCGAKIGAIIACQNWRLAEPELTHCISWLHQMLLTSPRHAQKAKALPLQLKTYILDASR